MTGDTQPYNHPEGDEQNFHTDLAVGEILRRARLQYQLSYEQVNRDLRISPHILEALESGNYSQLPGQAYMMGFLRTYAEYLGLDGGKLIQLLKQQINIQTERPHYVFPKITHDRLAPPSWVIWSSALSLILFFIIWSLLSHAGDEKIVPPVPKELTAQLTPPPKPKMTPSTLDAYVLPDDLKSKSKAGDAVLGDDSKSKDGGVKNSLSSEPDSVPANDAQKSHAILIKATQDSWIDVRNPQGETVFSRVLRAGEEFWVPQIVGGAVGDSYTLTAGNAGGVTLYKGGVAQSSLGAVGEVVRNYKLQ